MRRKRSCQTARGQHPGRVAKARVPLLVYLHHSEGWTERNQHLLETLGNELRRCPGLWLVAGDFNMEPTGSAELATPERPEGVLVAPTQPTVRHGALLHCFD